MEHDEKRGGGRIISGIYGRRTAWDREKNRRGKNGREINEYLNGAMNLGASSTEKVTETKGQGVRDGKSRLGGKRTGS